MRQLRRFYWHLIGGNWHEASGQVPATNLYASVQVRIPVSTKRGGKP